MEDRRVIKTKKAIRDALFELVVTKGINEISITEVCNKAYINRKTFYLHYNTTMDVLNESFTIGTNKMLEILAEINREKKDSLESILIPFLKMIQKDQKMEAILKSQNASLFLAHLEKALDQATETRMRQSDGIYVDEDSHIPMIATFISSGVITTYYKYRNSMDVTELAKLLSKIIMDIISTK